MTRKALPLDSVSELADNITHLSDMHIGIFIISHNHVLINIIDVSEKIKNVTRLSRYTRLNLILKSRLNHDIKKIC